MDLELQALLLVTSLIELVITHSIMSHNLNTAWNALFHSYIIVKEAWVEGSLRVASCNQIFFRKTDLHIKHPDK